MTEEEIKLRSKFYLAPQSTTLDDLRAMDKKYTAYPGATQEQAKELYENIKKTHGHLTNGYLIKG